MRIRAAIATLLLVILLAACQPTTGGGESQPATGPVTTDQPGATASPYAPAY